MAKYSIDTSALMDGWSRYYPPTTFPSLWLKIDALITEQRLFMSEEAYRETQQKDDDLCQWAKDRKDSLVVVTGPEMQGWVKQLMSKPEHAALVDVDRARSAADPFVIAVAQASGLTVVTGELFNLLRKKPRIPDVCHRLGVPWCSFLDLVKQEKWAF